ncbi:MAG: hypothetical protein ACYCYI_08115 [Saccharofermentanales bacterium]
MDMKKKKDLKKILLLTTMLIPVFLLMTGCIPGDGTSTPNDKAGFFWGIWHGWIAPVSLIISIFKSEISIYEVNNVGILYNFGYYIAVISGFGGLALNRKRRRRSEQREE